MDQNPFDDSVENVHDLNENEREFDESNPHDNLNFHHFQGGYQMFLTFYLLVIFESIS